MKATQAQALTAAAQTRRLKALAARERAARAQLLQQKKAARELRTIRLRRRNDLKKFEHALEQLEQEILQNLSYERSWAPVRSSSITKVEELIAELRALSRLLDEPLPLLPPTLNRRSSRNTFAIMSSQNVLAALELYRAAELQKLRDKATESYSDSRRFLDEYDHLLVEDILQNASAGVELLEEAIRVTTGKKEYRAFETRRKLKDLGTDLAQLSKLGDDNAVVVWGDSLSMCYAAGSEHAVVISPGTFSPDISESASILWNTRLLDWILNNEPLLGSLFSLIKERAKRGRRECKFLIFQEQRAKRGTVELRHLNGVVFAHTRLDLPVSALDVIQRVLSSNNYSVSFDRDPSRSRVTISW